MKKITTFLCTLALLFGVVGGVKAQDYQIYQRQTSVADGDVIAIVNENDGTGKAFYSTGRNVLSYGTYADAFNSTNAAICFKVVSLASDADESVRGYYYLVAMTPGGEEYIVYGSAAHLNSQRDEDASWCCFIQYNYNLNPERHHGQDLDYGAVWDIKYENGGFSIRNIGTNKYLKDATPAKYDTPTYFTLCTLSTSAVTYTTIEQLKNHLFMLTANDGGTEQKLVFQDIWDVHFKAVDDAEYAFGGYYFKAEPVEVDTDNDGNYETYYSLHIYGPDGSDDNYYNTYLGHYVNLSGSNGVYNGNITFSGSCNPSGKYSYGQDVNYGALWTIVEGTGDNAEKFAFENLAGRLASNDKRYLNINDRNAATSKVYFTARNQYSYNTFYRTNTESDKFLTFSFPYDATITDATVYTLSNVDNLTNPTKAYIEEVEDGVVSAGKGYILKTTAAKNVTVTVSDLTSFSKSTSDNGALVAVLYPQRVPQNSYVLSGGDWLIADDATENNRPKAASTRAYLDLSKAGEGEPVLGARYVLLNFEGGDETGITLQEISEDVENAGMNDGKYFESGKIVIVKNGVKYSTNGQILK